MKLISSETLLKHSRTPGKRHELDDIFAPVLFLQKIVGSHILDPSWAWRKIIPKFTATFSLITYVIIGTIQFIRETDDFALCAEAIFTFIIIFQFTFQVMPYIFYRLTFNEAYILVKTALFKIIEDVAPERSEYLKVMMKYASRAVIFSIISSSSSYILPVLWSCFNGHRINLSPSTLTLMPMTSPTFEIGLVLHTVFFIVVATATLATNMWFIVLVIFLCETCDCAVKILERQEKTYDVSYEDSLNMTLKEFYSVHVVLMRYLCKLNLMYKWPMLTAMITVYATTCIYLLVLNQEPNWKLAIVVLLEFTEITACNVLGELIKMKAENMRQAILYFDWMGLKLKHRKNYFIIICYMNKNFGVRTAAGADLSLVTLTSIYKGSYQAYAVFNSMNN